MPTLADVNPVAEVLAWLQSHTSVLAAVGGVSHISGRVEPPYPHIRVEPSPGGSYRDLRWAIEPEITVTTVGDVDGSPGQAALRRIHHIVLLATAEIPRRTHQPGQTVVSHVRAVSGTAPLATPLGSRGWTTALTVVCHPGA